MDVLLFKSLRIQYRPGFAEAMPRNRQNRTRGAMTAINFRIVLSIAAAN
jgi:hypothetical protein